MRIRSSWLLNFGGWIAAKLVRLLFRTVKINYQMAEPTSAPRHPGCDRRYLYCFWHEYLLLPIGLASDDYSAGLVSRHQDGGFLTMAMKHLGIRAVRGSSSRGGSRALRELLTVAKEYHISITPDGPRGPRREMKNGIVYLASQCGNPIVTVTFACENAWILRGNWTDLVIPKPFSKVHAIATTPIVVPPDLDREGIEEYQTRLQQELEALDRQVDAILGIDRRQPPVTQTIPQPDSTFEKRSAA